MIFILIGSLLNHLTKSNLSIPIKGNSTLGYYYIEAYIGNPPQKQDLILDTGSHLTIFPCEGCTECRSHMSKIFKSSKSNSFKYLIPNEKYFGWQCSNSDNGKCKMRQGYTEGSEYSGYFGIDDFKFTNDKNSSPKSMQHIFGCAMQETGEFYSQEVDGIIGFGPVVSNGSYIPPTLLELEKKENIFKNGVFSICLAANGGVLQYEDWNYNLHLKNHKKQIIDCNDMNWNDEYMVDLSGISIG